MEDYIFIIIAILLSVFAAVNKKKKEQARALERDEEREYKPFFGDIFDDDFFSPPQPVANTVPPPVVKPAPKPKPKEKKQPPPQMDAPAKMQRQPLQRETLRHSFKKPERKMEKLEIVELADDESKAGKKRHPALEGFSMKKAVIYSEIMQRKF